MPSRPHLRYGPLPKFRMRRAVLYFLTEIAPRRPMELYPRGRSMRAIFFAIGNASTRGSRPTKGRPEIYLRNRPVLQKPKNPTVEQIDIVGGASFFDERGGCLSETGARCQAGTQKRSPLGCKSLPPATSGPVRPVCISRPRAASRILSCIRIS